MKLELRVAAMLSVGGKLLVQYRPDVPEEKRVYALAGGHIEPGETMEGALRREFDEELGLAVEIRGLVCVIENFWHEGEPYRNSRGELVQPEEVHEIGFYFDCAPADPEKWHAENGLLRCREPHIVLALLDPDEAIERLQPEAVREPVAANLRSGGLSA